MLHSTRLPISVVIALLAILLLAACGSNPPVEPPLPSATPEPEPTALSDPTDTVEEMPTATTANPTETVAPPTETTEIAPTATEATAEPNPPTESNPPATATQPVASPGTDEAPYLDDRSSPQSLVMSYFNAINSRAYARAYSYWENPDALPPFAEFEQGYAETESSAVTLGEVGVDAGAGQRYYTVPVALSAQTTSGESQYFVGCYVLHQSQPAIQGEPPFRPLAIRSADVRATASSGDAEAALPEACQEERGGNPALLPTPAPTAPGDISSDIYLDDRSDPVAVLRSLFNAVNRREYVRAYSYWQNAGEGASGAPPFPQFAEGYEQTESVQLTTGTPSSDAGAGQLYWRVPVILQAQNSDGTMETFAGCYSLHLARPEIQAEPPFEPMGITGATVEQIPNDADLSAALADSCS